MDKKEVIQEKIKGNSKHLRGKIEEELHDGKDDFSKPSGELLKFHGIYQEKNRDKEHLGDVADNPTIFMIRSRIPGGRITREKWLIYDKIATNFGHGSIRITSRQTIQLHWVVKGDVKEALKEIHSALLTTSGGCGDIVRNVMQAPNPLGEAKLSLLDPIVEQLSSHYLATSNAYAEIWLDGKRVDPESEQEPLFGDRYLPRKFKVGVTLAGNNSIDIYTQDIGIAATLNAKGAIDGFFILAGGGQGRSHNNPETFPLQGELLGWIEVDKLLLVTDAIVAIQRDCGDRTDRKHARMKYLMHDKGKAWFQNEILQRTQVAFLEKELPPWRYPNYLGWHRMQNGKFALGVHILSGRVMDRPGYFIKSALQEIFSKFCPLAQMTPEQDLILLDLNEGDKEAILAIFDKNEVDVKSPSPLYNRALSCVAMPTCNLAITESERWLPALLFEMEKLLKKHDLSQRAPNFRIVGCPNGCARPYNAELALVGEAPGDGYPPSPGKYQVWIGGSDVGTCLGFELFSLVDAEKIIPLFDEIFLLWKKEAVGEERLGAFASRLGKNALKSRLESAIS